MTLDRYYNLFDATKRHEEILFLAGDGLQARELNELQSILGNRIAGLGGAIYKEGDPVKGADIIADPDTGAVRLEAGEIFLRGAIRPVPAGTFTIPVEGRVAIGVRFSESLVTALEDPGLRDPAVGTDGYLEPGAARRVFSLAWGWEGGASSDGGSGAFHAIYTVTNGVLDNRVTPPAMDAVATALARYDREANGGFYVVSGLSAAFLEASAGDYVFSLAEGRANINGYKVERVHGARLRYPLDPDLQTVEAEPHVFTNAGGGSMRITLNRAPLSVVRDVKVTKEKTVTVTHGAYTGAVDTLPDSSVVQVVSVAQGGTSYAVGTSYTVSGDEIDWSPGGAEPAPGSTYTVTYRYIDSATWSAADDDGFTVSGVVNGTTIYVDYAWKMPRVDVLVMNQNGELSRLKGVSRTRQPSAPIPPSDALALASITYDWRAANEPEVRNIAVRAIPVSDIEDMRGQIMELYGLWATSNLRTDASIREAGAKKGVFVDPFVDGSGRDAGVVQSAAIVGGMLTLPIGVNGIYTAASGFTTLDYTLVPVLEQIQRTGSMKINPYQAFEPIPAKITLLPAVDEWTVSNTVFTDDSTERFIRTGHFVPGASWVRSTSTEVSDTVVSTSSVSAQFLRQLTVQYTAENFGPTEVLDYVKFDGIDLTPSTRPVASGSGVLSGSFSIPAGIPEGSKRVEFRGRGGSYGLTTYVGRGVITTETRRRIITITEEHVDPLAQTFVLPDTRVLHAVDLWFTAKGGPSPVVVQIRETENGVPTRTVLTEGRVAASAIVTGGGPTRVTFDPLVAQAGQDYALVILSDDADHAVAVAELGKFDPVNGWVTRQPYQIGVLLSSSNAVTWTAHQEKDLTFRLLAAEYSSTPKEITLGTYNVTAVSDMIALAAVERPAATTDVEFVVVDASGRIHTLTEMQPLNLSDPITGNVTVKARLTGGGTVSPVLYPAAKTAMGKLEVTADYLSRRFPAGTGFALTVAMECILPGTSSVAVYAESATTGNWVAVPFSSGSPVGDGWEERVFKATGLTGVGTDKTTRLRIVLNGSPANRPYLRKLTGIAI